MHTKKCPASASDDLEFNRLWLDFGRQLLSSSLLRRKRYQASRKMEGDRSDEWIGGRYGSVDLDKWEQTLWYFTWLIDVGIFQIQGPPTLQILTSTFVFPKDDYSSMAARFKSFSLVSKIIDHVKCTSLQVQMSKQIPCGFRRNPFPGAYVEQSKKKATIDSTQPSYRLKSKKCFFLRP